MDLAAHKQLFTRQLPEGISAVFFGSSFPDSGIDSVNVDFRQGTIEAVEELIRLGHRRIPLLQGFHPGPGRGSDTRLEVFKDALSRQGLSLSREDFILSGHTIEEAYKAFLSYLKGRKPDKRATALFAINDITAIGAIRAARDSGLSIPGDLSIIGVDNTPIAEYLPVSLTSVSYPTREIARTATEFLISRIQGESATQREASFSTHLVKRESTGPVPSGI
jgi:LacI family transcriptional regulator